MHRMWRGDPGAIAIAAATARSGAPFVAVWMALADGVVTGVARLIRRKSA